MSHGAKNEIYPVGKALHGKRIRANNKYLQGGKMPWMPPARTMP